MWVVINSLDETKAVLRTLKIFCSVFFFLDKGDFYNPRKCSGLCFLKECQMLKITQLMYIIKVACNRFSSLALRSMSPLPHLQPETWCNICYTRGNEFFERGCQPTNGKIMLPYAFLIQFSQHGTSLCICLEIVH